MSQGEKIVGVVSQSSISFRSRRRVFALAAVTAGLIGATSLSQVQAHDNAFDVRSENRAKTAELFLPQLEPGTYRLVVRKSDDAKLVGTVKPLSDFNVQSRPRWRDRTPAMKVRVPNEPAPERVVMPAVKMRTPAVMFTVPKNFAMIDAPRRVVAQKRFQAGWSGPNVSGDRLELVARGKRACVSSVLGISVHEYDANRDGEFTFLAPMRVGNYEIVYCSADQQRVLARHPIQVVAKTAALPDSSTVRRLRPATAPRSSTRFASRPSFELNSAVRDDGQLPRVRMMAPIASARVDTLESARSIAPIVSVRPGAFAEDASRVVTPVGRYRFGSQKLAQADAVPVFKVRPKFDDADDAADDRGWAREARDDSEVVDIAPRRRVKQLDDDAAPLQRKPRIRIFIDEDEIDKTDGADVDFQAKRPRFEDDDETFEQPRRQLKPEPEEDLREAKRPVRRSFDDEPVTARPLAQRPVFDDDPVPAQRQVTAAPEREKPATRLNARPTFDDDDDVMFGAVQPDENADARIEPDTNIARTTRRPSFDNDDDDVFDAAEPKDDRKDRLESKTDAVKTARRPSFDDDAFGGDDATDRTDDTGNEAPIDRADDFKSDEVGVAAAIARNKARYGDGTDDRDDFFTIKGRYSWYKPVTPKQAERTARLPAAKDDETAGPEKLRSRIEDRRRSAFDDEDDVSERDAGRLIELKGRDAFEADDRNARRVIAARPQPKAQPRELDLDDFSDADAENGGGFARGGSSFGDQDDVQFGPPVNRADRQFASRDTDADFENENSSATSRRPSRGTGSVAMIPRTRATQIAPQFDRIQPVKAGYRFAAGWTGNIRGKGWIAIARSNSRLDDYLSLRSAATKGELKFRAPSQPGRYELRFLSQDRRVVLARQSFEVEVAPVRLVALEFVDPSDDLNVWWAGPGDRSDSLTVARVGTGDSRYLSKQSVGTGNPLKIKAPTQPGTYEMRYVNGTDNRVLFRRKIVVAESQPTLLGP